MTRCARPFRRASTGVTLIETVAALVIIGTLVAMALAAQSRLVRQWHEADLRIEAAKVADDLIATWWDQPGMLPHNQVGVSPNYPGWRWRTAPLEDRQLLNDRLEIVRVSVYAPIGTPFGNEPLCEIDLLTRLDTVGGGRP